MLGCGDVGFTVVNELKKLDIEPVIIDHDAKKAEYLGFHGYKTIEGDFGSPEVLGKADIEHAEAVVITVRDFSATEQALKAIAGLGVKPIVIARVSEESETPEARRLGANGVLPSAQILASSLLKAIHDVKAMAKEKRLRALLRELGRGRLAIVLQDKPSLDALASGAAFKCYAKAFGADSDIICRWDESKQPESAFISSLGLHLTPVEGVSFEEYTGFVLIATHANCALPRDILPTVVIDNHLVLLGEVRARFCDIEPVGATSTLLTDYLRHAAVELDEATATALAVGILSNTQGFTNGATLPDLKTLEYLLPYVNTDLLRRLCADKFSLP